MHTKDVDKYYPAKGRVILHLDMNAFYCSVHAADDPVQYAGKPTAVSGSLEKRRGIIVTCSYEARARGVKTGMHVKEALKLEPNLILIQPNFELYRTYSRGFLQIARQFTPLVEAVSIDECYLDITGSKLLGTPLDIASSLQKRIQEEWSIPCSIGIAPNKLLAKMASDMKKPNGITVLRLRDVPAILWDKPCQQLFGIGQKTAEKLKKLHIYTIGQLAKTDEQLLIKTFGVYGAWLKEAANGIDFSEVKTESGPSKSIGHATTLPKDLTDIDDVNRVLLNLADQTTRRLRKQKMMAKSIQITIRKPDMTTFQRSITLSTPTHHMEEVAKQALRLFKDNWIEGEPVRLLGISLSNLIAEQKAAVQLDLFDYEEEPKKEALIKTMDQLRDKYGESAIVTAGMIHQNSASILRNKKLYGTSLEKIRMDDDNL